MGTKGYPSHHSYVFCREGHEQLPVNECAISVWYCISKLHSNPARLPVLSPFYRWQQVDQ